MSCLVTHDLCPPGLLAALDLCVMYYLGQLYNNKNQSKVSHQVSYHYDTLFITTEGCVLLLRAVVKNFTKLTASFFMKMYYGCLVTFKFAIVLINW